MSPHNTSINLRELSFLTGFSVSTVSKALNDKLDISAKTKRLITEVAKEHNYVPNSFAVGLRNRRSRTVAIIVPQINIKFYGDLLSYFQQIADRRSYRIVVFQSFKNTIKEKEHLNNICDGSIEGAILISGTKDYFLPGDYTVPISMISIAEALHYECLNEYCFQEFEKLLDRIA